MPYYVSSVGRDKAKTYIHSSDLDTYRFLSMRRDLSKKFSAIHGPFNQETISKLLCDSGIEIQEASCSRFVTVLGSKFHKELLRKVYQHNMRDFILRPSAIKAPGM